MEKYKEEYFALNGCKNIIHIGGHKGEESEIYKSLGIKYVFVEPIPRLANIIRDKGINVIEKAVARESGKIKFNIAKVSERSSMYDPLDNVMEVREIIEVQSIRLSEIQEGFDGIAIDAQGATYEILKSGQLNFKVIICEVSKIPRYSGEETKETIEKLLEENNYIKIREIKHKTLDIYDTIWKKQ